MSFGPFAFLWTVPAPVFSENTLHTTLTTRHTPSRSTPVFRPAARLTVDANLQEHAPKYNALWLAYARCVFRRHCMLFLSGPGCASMARIPRELREVGCQVDAKMAGFGAS